MTTTGAAPASSIEAGARTSTRLPAAFVANGGQLAPAVAFATVGSGPSVAFTRTGLTITLVEPRATTGPPRTVQRDVVVVTFVGATPTWPVGEHASGGVASYFSGPPSAWRTGVALFDRIAYHDLWPGIDMTFSAGADGLKYGYVVGAGADPSRIRVAYRGARSVVIAADGSLRVSTPARTLVDAAPEAYQTSDAGSRRPVESGFEPSGAGPGLEAAFGYRLGPYDASRPLVIDPAFYVTSGYIGGAGDDQAFRVTIDAAGYEYVTGLAGSDQATFPVTVGPDLTYNGGVDDAFVAKLLPHAAGYVYLGYIGGAGDTETGLSISVDAAGAAFVSGTTNSAQSTFPVTVGPDLTYGGVSDMFIAKVSSDGTSLVYCGYVGGAGFEEGMRVTVDAQGAAYFGTFSTSSEATLPVTVGPDLTWNGGYDGIVGKVSPDGTRFVYLGYIGGAGDDYIRGIVIDAAGDAYVTGIAASDETTFPVRGGPDLTFNGGADDGFVSEVGPDGTSLIYSGYLGGAGSDKTRWIDLGPDGSVYVTGHTTSDETSFPVVAGPDLTYGGGKEDAFVARIAAGGTGIVWCGYIGGSGRDIGRSVALAADGSLWVVGETTSNESSFPVTGGPDLTYGGQSDAFVARVRPDGAGLILLSYLGGAAPDFATGIAVGADGHAYVSGTTASDQTTFPVLGGPDLTYNGGQDGFLIEIAFTPDSSVTAGPPPLSNQRDATFVFASPDPTAAFTCSMDGETAPCASPGTYSALADGPHAFSVSATDAWGDVGPAATWSWTVDSVPPTVTITSGPAGVTKSRNATFAFVADDPAATFTCAVDGGPATPCASPSTTKALSDGGHSMSIAATDGAGNGSVPATWTWTVDTVAPIVTITSGPDTTTTATNALFTFVADDPGATFTCSRDGGSFKACTSPKMLNGFSVGTHTFSIRATDAIGNRGPAASWTWTVVQLEPRAHQGR